jgi:hypothetical protein
VFWRTIGRIIVVAFAFFLATMAAGFVLFTLGLERVTGELHRLGPDGDTVTASLSMLDQGLALVASVSIIPALLVIFVGEIVRIRSVIYYVAGGGAALAAVPLLARVQQSGAFAMPEHTVWQVFATAGFAGGLVYWLIAGRNA